MYKYLLTIAFNVIVLVLEGQKIEGLVARYSFNNNNGKDDMGKNNAKLYNVLPSKDRFGNPDFAYYCWGNLDSYINLGSSNILKPRAGTISLWARINMVTYNGKGIRGNPIITARSHTGPDFNEAYSIGYNFDLKHLTAATSLSELHQSYVHPDKTSSLREWHHLVMTYDDNFLCFYQDGIMEGKVSKNFKSVFAEGDPVLVGICVDAKNVRMFCGSVDDIEIYNRVLSTDEILQLYNSPNPNTSKLVLKWALIFLIVALAVFLIIWLIKQRINRLVNIEKEKNQLQNRWYEQENRVLTAQMDPHFIFNSLNTIQQFIITNDNEKAQLYLSKFSRLMRKILESNAKETISLREEIEIIEKYLEIESLRFNNVFKYNISFGDKLDPAAVFIPHFLIQPLIENAIWHGLLPKTGNKELIVAFEKMNDKTLICVIEDNGIGRKVRKISEGAEKKSSFAISFIEQRLLLMSKMSGKEYKIDIVDLKDAESNAAGTRVIMTIPIIKQ